MTQTPCTVVVKPPNSQMVTVATKVTVEWTEHWLAEHAKALRARGWILWVIEEPEQGLA